VRSSDPLYTSLSRFIFSVGIKASSIDITTLKRAVFVGCLDVVKYMRNSDGRLRGNTITAASAAAGGNLEVLKYLHDNGCPWDRKTIMSAAEYGKLECIKYAHTNGVEWNEYACHKAAKGGHLETLKYLHDNGCPWDAKTCSQAAEGGHLEVIKYLHENGCPWDWNVSYFAWKKGYKDIVNYVHENEGPCGVWACPICSNRRRVAGLPY
jgi:hypothetical protein